MRDLGTFRGHKVSCEGQLKSMGCLLDSVSIRGERSDIPGLSEGGMKGQTFLACLQRHTVRRGLHSPKPWISDTTVFLPCVPRYHLCVRSQWGQREGWGQDEKWRLLPDSLASGTWRVMHSLYFSLTKALWHPSKGKA